MALSRPARFWDRIRLSPRAEREAAKDRIELSLLSLGALFVFINALSFSMVSDGRLDWRHLWAPAVWLAGTLLFHVVLKTFKPGRDPYILPIVAFLSGWDFSSSIGLHPTFSAVRYFG